jgi:hypothetical protein
MREGSGAVGALGGGPLGGSRTSRCRSRPELISPLLLRSPVLFPPPAIARGAEGAAGTRTFGASGIFFSVAGFIQDASVSIGRPLVKSHTLLGIEPRLSLS